MKSCFIVGTDTGVGKTLTCGLLANYIKERGHSVITQKWIETGSSNFSHDISAHLKFMKRKRSDIKEYLSYACPYLFKFPASPHLAAEKQGIKIDSHKIIKSYKFLSKRFDFVIVEGTGGALVPYNRNGLIIDIAKSLRLPVLIVADNKLGAINHTLLTIEALKQRGMEILGIVFNSTKPGFDKAILNDNPKISEIMSKVKALGIMPCLKKRGQMREAFDSIGEGILRRLKEAQDE